MNTVFSGFIEDLKYSFVVMDTGDVVTTQDEGVALLDNLEPSIAKTSSSFTIGSGGTSGTLTINKFNNPWVGESGGGGVASSTLQAINDFGVVISAAGNLGGSSNLKSIESNGIDAIYSPTNSTTAKIYPPVYGAISLNVNKDAANLSLLTLNEYLYSSDTKRYRFDWDGHNVLYIQSHPDGTVFFFTLDPVKKYTLDRVGSSSSLLNYIGVLEPQKVYCLRRAVVAATGFVYNAAGGAAENCTVIAFNRVSGRLVGKTKSNADGSYALQCIASKGDQLFIVCLDDDGVAPDFDAQIIDRVLVD